MRFSSFLFSPLFILMAIIVLMLSGSGCESESGVFRMRNPFDHQSVEASQFRRRKAESRAVRLENRKPGHFDQATPQSPYFGQAGTNRDLDLNAISAPRPAQTPAANSPAPIPPAPSPGDSGPVEKRLPGTGSPCYQCNGKGYRLSSLNPGAEFVECPNCGGTGRR